MVQARPVQDPQGVMAAAAIQLPRQSATAFGVLVSLDGATAWLFSVLTGNGEVGAAVWGAAGSGAAPPALLEPVSPTVNGGTVGNGVVGTLVTNGTDGTRPGPKLPKENGSA